MLSETTDAQCLIISNRKQQQQLKLITSNILGNHSKKLNYTQLQWNVCSSYKSTFIHADSIDKYTGVLDSKALFSLFLSFPLSFLRGVEFEVTFTSIPFDYRVCKV